MCRIVTQKRSGIWGVVCLFSENMTVSDGLFSV